MITMDTSAYIQGMMDAHIQYRYHVILSHCKEEIRLLCVNNNKPMLTDDCIKNGINESKFGWVMKEYKLLKEKQTLHELEYYYHKGFVDAYDKNHTKYSQYYVQFIDDLGEQIYNQYY